MTETKKYRTVVCDPPWQVDAGPVSLHAANDGYRRQSSNRLRARALPYPTMTVKQIAALPVSNIAADDAHLYLWTINSYVESAYAIVRTWGFTPGPLLVWAKAPKGRGLGGAFSIATEYVLVARRGSLPHTGRVERNWWDWKRGAHSAKPAAFLDIVEQVSPGPYLEMFARPPHRLGWDSHGDESANTATLEPRP